MSADFREEAGFLGCFFCFLAGAYKITVASFLKLSNASGPCLYSSCFMGTILCHVTSPSSRKTIHPPSKNIARAKKNPQTATSTLNLGSKLILSMTLKRSISPTKVTTLPTVIKYFFGPKYRLVCSLSMLVWLGGKDAPPVDPPTLR